MNKFNAKQWVLNALWLVTAILLIIGLTQPMFTFTHFYFFDDTFSLVDAIFHLAAQGEYILFGLLFLFSLVMPVVKMLMLLYSVNAGQLLTNTQRMRLDKIAKLGKWSMLDVYVIAILAVTIKLSLIASVTIHYGLVAFALSVTLSMALPWMIAALYHVKATLVIDDSKAIDWKSEYALQANSDVVNALQIGQSVVISHQHNNNRLIDVYDEHGLWQIKAQTTQVNNGLQLHPIASRHH
ncbi:paraquat-inducible protein A [Psychrobium sp. nBUS_13]|uniref:paraquat-inducible protein A n=1 Tax=Psychrobium sp. nBUS_13 TaxID=3395319 RepID=UPI003EBA2D4E